MEREIKFLKSNLKKKVRISSELLVCFLITGNILFGANIEIIDGIIKENVDYKPLKNLGTISSIRGSSVPDANIENFGIIKEEVYIYNGDENLGSVN